MPINTFNPQIRETTLGRKLGNYLEQGCHSNVIKRTDVTSGIWGKEYNGCLFKYTNNRPSEEFDGYIGNVRKRGYSKTWDSLSDKLIDPGDENSEHYIYHNILRPSSKLQKLWNDEVRSKSDDYVDYTNKIFGKQGAWYNVLGGIIDGRGAGIYLGDSGVKVVSNLNLKTTLAGDIVGTLTGKETPRGKFALKAAAISLANTSLSKIQRNVVNSGVEWLKGKVNAWIFGGESESFSIKDKSITNTEGIVDDILKLSGLDNIANIGLNEIGNLLGEDIEKALHDRIYGTIPNEASIFDIDHVASGEKNSIKPNLELFLTNNTLGKFERNILYSQKRKGIEGVYGGGSSYKTTEQRNNELIKNTGKLTVKLISSNLNRNKFGPNYSADKLAEAGYQKRNSDYSSKISKHLNSDIKLRGGEEHSWLDMVSYNGNYDDNINTPNKPYKDRLRYGINYEKLKNREDDEVKDTEPNSLLSKTKRLFEDGKIKTMISSFYSNGEKGTGNRTDIQTGVTERFGLSHGRNLLKAGLNKGIDTLLEKDVNGLPYDDPYCRVWTWYKQYRTIGNLIRPFDEDGMMELERNLGEGYANIRPGMQSLKENSTLMNNGFVQISPFSLASSSGDIKNYMFSIENLAWKDLSYDDMERNLCKSQIGPNGGRIMWFAPYDIKFNEQVSVRWNNHEFIGRGERVYTYVNTERTGNLSFKIIVDHPSIINYMKHELTVNKGYDESDEEEQKLLRFFAGCETLETGKTEIKKEPEPIIEKQLPEPEPQIVKPETEKVKTEEILEEILFDIYFPNDYSGIDYLKTEEPEDAYLKGIDYLYSGHGKFNDGRGSGYESNQPYSLSYVDGITLYGEPSSSTLHRIDSEGNIYYGSEDTPEEYKPIPNFYFEYQTNAIIRKEKYGYFNTNSRKIEDGLLIYNMTITDSIVPNYATKDDPLWTSNVNGFLPRYGYNREISYWDTTNYQLNATANEGTKYSFRSLYEAIKRDDEGLIELLKTVKIIDCLGTANEHGKVDDNNKLKSNRVKIVAKWLETFCKKHNLTNVTVNANTKRGFEPAKGSSGKENSSDRISKIGRSVRVLMIKEVSSSVSLEDAEIEGAVDVVHTPQEVNEIAYTEYEPPIEKKIKKGRYDEESSFFEKLGGADPQTAEFIHNKIREKIKYFVPAFHSTTPEGFNARLTFLHQCTRQGPTPPQQTVGADNSTNANNLAFGRQPYCILRIGDFFHTKILITSLTIDYEPLQWDLNPEGIGVQPMIANINLNITHVGGSDLTGPISRLQNAVSFNFYANTSVYDDRSDVRKTDEEIENMKLEEYSHIIEQYGDNDVDNLTNAINKAERKYQTSEFYKPMYNPFTYDKE